jgi:hypothetical protein
MVYVDPKFEQRRIQVLGGSKKVSQPQATQKTVTSSKFIDPKFEQRRTQIITANPVKKIAQTPVKIAQAKKQEPKKIAITEKSKKMVTDFFGDLSIDRLKEQFKIGSQQAIGSIKTGLGAIRENNRQEAEKSGFSMTRNIGKEAESKNKALIQKGQEQQKKTAERQQKLGQAKGYGTKIIEGITQSTPSFLSGFGISATTLLITKNPSLATSLGFSSTYAQTSGEIYNEAKNYGVSDKKAFESASLGASAVALLDTLPLGRILERSPQGQQIKKAILKEITKGFVMQGGEEALTEGVQQVVQNAVAKVYYNDQQGIFEGVPESAITGFLMGGGAGVAIDSSIGLSTPDVETIKQAEVKVQEAIETPVDERSFEQQEIVDSLLTQTVTPQQAISMVANSETANTTDGKEIIKTAVEAQAKGKNIQIKQSEDGKEIEVTVVAKRKPSETVAEVQSEEKEVDVEAGLYDTVKLYSGSNKLKGSRYYTQTKAYAEAYGSNVREIDLPKSEIFDTRKPEHRQIFEGIRSKLKVNNEIDTNNGLPKSQGDAKEIEQALTDAGYNFKAVALSENTQVKGDPNGDISYFVQKSSQADPYAMPSRVAQPSQAEQKVDSKGRVINTKKVQAVKEILDDKLKQIRETARTQEDIEAGITSLYEDITKRSNNDKVVLSALRTLINKEMYGLAGAGGDYESAYATFQTVIKEDPELGKLLSKMEDYVKALDEKLLTAQEPQRIVPIVEKKEKQQPAPKRETTPSKEEPVGTGKVKNSKLFERVKETLGEEYEAQKKTYNELSLEKQASAVVDLISENPEKAVRIARGFEEPPAGMTQNALAIALADMAQAKGDMKTASELWTQTSLRSTRLGQEIVSLRGKFAGNESLNAIKAILNVRMDKIIKQYDSVIKGLSIPEKATTIQKVDALVKHQTKKLKVELTKQQKRMLPAQDLLNSLICK